MAPKVHCGKRGEKKCKEEPDLCLWDNVTNKCLYHTTKATTPTKTTKGRKISPKSEIDLKVTNEDKVRVVKVVKEKVVPKTMPKATKPSTPVDEQWVEELKTVKHRHCNFYQGDAKLLHHEDVNLKSKLKLAYDPKFKSPTNVHIGQRKLLMSEIQLLTEYTEHNTLPPLVLYVGSAPGTHLITLSAMFPHAFFILYDGAKFDPILYKHPRFQINDGERGFVTTEMVHRMKFNTDQLLFVSDIRLGESNKSKFEDGVNRDMTLQREWMDILKPKMSLLKFRMSYLMKHGEQMSYTKGTILYGIWPKEASGETRLLVHQKDVGTMIDYDFKSYEEVMFFHNKFARPYCYTPTVAIKKFILSPENKTYCFCYDCRAEINTMERYAKITKKKMSIAEAIKLLPTLKTKPTASELPLVPLPLTSPSPSPS